MKMLMGALCALQPLALPVAWAGHHHGGGHHHHLGGGSHRHSVHADFHYHPFMQVVLGTGTTSSGMGITITTAGTGTALALWLVLP